MTTEPTPEPRAYYEELVAKATEWAASHEWSTAAAEFDHLRTKWTEGPAWDDEDAKSALFTAFNEAHSAFAAARKAHYELVQERRQNNLRKREDLIARMQALVDGKQWGRHGEASQIQHRFEDIKPLPPEAEEQNERFRALVKLFEEHKVEYLVNLRQKEEENLIGKLFVLDKLKALVDGLPTADQPWTDRDEDVETLSEQFRRIGKVAKEKADDIWERYKSLRDTYFKAKTERDPAYKAALEAAVAAKTALCEAAEKLLDETDLALAAKEMNVLHKKWKETAALPRELSESLWERFKAASDTFNAKKHDNLDTIRDQENQNYDLKVALCEKAEALGSATDAPGDAVEALFKEWNAIGPVPRRKNKKIWLRFKAAVDAYQQNRRGHYKQLRLEQKDNLTKKREIIAKIAALAEAGATDTLAAELKALQAEYQALGFVPIKYKETIWKEYRAACDSAYALVRATDRPERAPRHERTHTDHGGDTRTELKARQNDLFRLKKECEELNSTILHYADAKTYIKPNKGGNVLIEEIQAKIDAAREQLAVKQKELVQLRKEIDELAG